ncbi:MAG: MFS transporter [Chloroflexi bacterium]|nr:MFS transporter [Chloroflexota bacterium]
MKLDYGKTALLGFGFFGVSLIWSLYNSYVPVFLERDFLLSATIVGFVMTFDNIAALFIQPWIGALSDRTHSRWGRRMPYIMLGAPIGALAFMAIPFAGSLPVFMAVIIVMLLAMSAFRTPVIALMPDITPSPLRSKANGVINLMGGIGAILAFFVGARLYDIGRAVPFIAAAVVLVLAVLIVFWRIREPTAPAEPPPAEAGVLANVRLIARDRDKSALYILLAIFAWFVGFNIIETFFTLYGVNALGIRESTASLTLGFLAVMFVLFSLPSAFIATKFGRKPTIIAGLALMLLLLAVVRVLPAATQIAALVSIAGFQITVLQVLLMAAGLAWAMVNINSLPMVVDIAPQDRIGTYTGLYYFASTLAAIGGPWLGGILIDATGRDYTVIFTVAPFAMLLAIGFMLGVRRGERAEELHPSGQATETVRA